MIAAHSDQAWVKILAYTIATAVGISRVYQGVHWTSAVLAEALLGTMIGNSVEFLNDRFREQSFKIAVAPIYEQGRRGAEILLTLLIQPIPFRASKA